MKHGRELSFDEDGRPVLITNAAIPYEVEHRQRVRKYLIMMSVRVPALVGAAIAYGIWHNGLISLAIIVISIPLPWMAVLIANDRPPRKAEEFRRYQGGAHTAVGPAGSPTLEQRPSPAPQPAPDDPPYDVP